MSTQNAGKKEYMPMQVQELGSIASLTQGSAGIYGGMGMGMGMGMIMGMTMTMTMGK